MLSSDDCTIIHCVYILYFTTETVTKIRKHIKCKLYYLPRNVTYSRKKTGHFNVENPIYTVMPIKKIPLIIIINSRCFTILLY